MSLLAYNGVALDLLDTQGISREAVLSDDGTVYHYTRWRFDVIGVINPDATSYNAAGLPAFEQSPVVTDIVLRHRMMQPQRTLVYLVGNEVLLQTPLTGYQTDADNGPTPLHFDILEVQGMNTLVVRFVVECSVNECSGTNRPIILSHRWGIRLDHDQDHYTTRTVSGVAVFRSDELLKQNKNPDQFRRDLFHPIGDNMKREGINVDVLPDGNSVRYSFVDVEQAFNLGTNSPATRIEIEHVGGMTQPGVAAVAADFAIQSAESAFQISLWMVAGFPAHGELAAIASTISAATLNTLRLGRSLLAEYWQGITVRAWGNRNSRKMDLRNVAIGVAMSKAGGTSALYATEAILSEDGMGKYVEFRLTNRFFSTEQIAGLAVAGAIRGAPGLIAQAIGAPPGLQPMLNGFSNDENVKTTGGQLVATQKPIGNPPFPASNNSRGTWLGDAVAEALQAPCSKPNAPLSGRNADQTFR